MTDEESKRMAEKIVDSLRDAVAIDIRNMRDKTLYSTWIATFAAAALGFIVTTGPQMAEHARIGEAAALISGGLTSQLMLVLYYPDALKEFNEHDDVGQAMQWFHNGVLFEGAEAKHRERLADTARRMKRIQGAMMVQQVAVALGYAAICVLALFQQAHAVVR